MNGGHVELEILPGLVEVERWGALYDETLALLQADERPLMSVRVVNGRREYTQTLEHSRRWPTKRRWVVVGDFDSLLVGEAATLYRHLQRRPSGAPACSASDILAPLARPRTVLSANTFGHPYSRALLAATATIEASLPGIALVRGGFDRDDARQACLWAERRLSRPIALPLVTRPYALATRLERLERGAPFLERLTWLYQGQRAQLYPILQTRFSTSLLRRWLLQRLCAAQNSSEKHVALQDGLALGFSEETMHQMACVSPQGPRLDPERFHSLLTRRVHRKTRRGARQAREPRPKDGERVHERSPRLESDEAASWGLLHFERLWRVDKVEALSPMPRVALGLLASRWLCSQPCSPSAFTVEHLLTRLRQRGVTLTEGAWRRLARLKEPRALRLLHAAALDPDPNIDAPRRALLENDALRQSLLTHLAQPEVRRALRQWRTLLNPWTGH